MRNVFVTLVMFTMFGCSSDDNVEPVERVIEEEGAEEVGVIEEDINNERQLIRTINVDENTYTRREYDSNGNLLSIVNNDGEITQTRQYDSDNILVSVINRFLTRFLTYDEQGRLIKEEISVPILTAEDVIDNFVERESVFIYEQNKITKTVTEYNQLLASQIPADVIFEDDVLITNRYTTEYYLNEFGNLSRIETSSLDGDYVNNLDFIYEENMRDVRIVGQESDLRSVIRTTSYEVEIQYTDVIDKTPLSFENNYIRNASDDLGLFILNFIGNSSVYYVNNEELNIIDDNGVTEIRTSSYDYTFDEEGFPTSLTIVDSSDSRVEDFITNRVFEWE